MLIAIHYLKLQSFRETHFLVCFDVMLSSLLQSSYLFLRAATLGRIPGFCVGSMSERAQCIETSLLSSCNANINHNLYINVDDTCISMFSYAHRIKVVWKGRKTNKVDATTPTEVLVKSSSRAE